MKDTIYVLGTCSTCNRILGELDGLLNDVAVQDIKKDHIDANALDFISSKLGSYEAAFNKRAMKYRAQGLNQKELSEAEWKELILGEYTFLKRPMAVIDGEVFAGNSKKTVEALKEKLNG